MEQETYIEKALKQIDDNGQVSCSDCGAIAKLGHLIVNHQNGTVKLVCDKCFKDKYMGVNNGCNTNKSGRFG